MGDHQNLKGALQDTLKCSGQLIKRHFSSKQQAHAVRVRDVSRLPLDFVNNLRINPTFRGPRPSIIAETEDYIVVHKPAFVHSHPLVYSDQDTILNFLAEVGKFECLSINEANYDRGLLYRLDHETSGVIVLAKTEELLKRMREQFHARMKKKFYWAIVQGNFNQDGKWTHYLKSSGLKGSRQKVSDDYVADSDAGLLSVQKIASHQATSLVLVSLSSGLRHQIRAQLSHLGFPIVGDELYGAAKSDRLYLHALRYEWEDSAEDLQADLFEQFYDLQEAYSRSKSLFSSL
jgi:23S rRNA pseudouridine1911/1915/1917 synthase